MAGPFKLTVYAVLSVSANLTLLARNPVRRPPRRGGGTLIGVLIMGCVRSGLTILNISPYWQKVIIGLIILIAVGIDMMRKRRR